MPIYDLTLPISPQLAVYPGDPPVEVGLDAALAHGDPFNLTRFNMSAHVGTHMDAPRHFLAAGATIDQLPLEWLIGPAVVAEVKGSRGKTGEDLGIEGNLITAADLAGLNVPPGTTRLLLKTRNSQIWTRPLTPEFATDFVALDASAAVWLVEHGIRLIGIDYLSIETGDDATFAVHTTLLAASIVILEGLNLSQVAPGAYQLIALPLKLEGADGAPARVVLIKNDIE